MTGTRLVTLVLMLAGALCTPCPGATPPAAQTAATAKPMQLEWKLLLPVAERSDTGPRPLPPGHDYLSEGDIVALQTGSYAANPELDKKRVRIPGFVVPLSRGSDGLLNEFLLVPYFGACIHLPPPPPNQVVHVRMRPGTGLKVIDDAVWVTGRLSIGVKTSSMGAASYVLDGESIEIYQPTSG